MSLEIIGAPERITKNYFDLIKQPPKDIISVDVADDEQYKINNLFGKLFQFKYRYVYEDNEKSVWSAVSKIPYPKKSTDPLYNVLSNVQNKIDLKFFTGDVTVEQIEIAGRVNIESEWSDFFLVDTLVKRRDGIFDNSIHTYVFRNDGLYTPIDIQESNLLFDYVPDEANAMELANGNSVVLGGIKDGYNRDLLIDVTLTNISNLKSPAVQSTLGYTLRNRNDNGPWTGSPSSPESTNGWFFKTEFVLGIVRFTGTPQVGDVISIFISGFNSERWFDFGGVQYTDRDFKDTFTVVVQPGWGIPDIVNAFIEHPNNGTGAAWNVFGATPATATPSRPFIRTNFAGDPNSLYFGMEARNPILPDNRNYIYDGIAVNITNSFGFLESDVFPTYKWSGLYRFGLVYYDKNGKTNGVFTNQQMSLRTGVYDTDFDWTPVGSQVILPENETAQLYIGHKPPEWADYYHIVRTKELSCDFSLMVIASNVEISTSYIYIDIHNIIQTNVDSRETSKVINYNETTFVDGDRIRITQKYNSSTRSVSWANTQPLDIPIYSVEYRGNRLYIKIKRVDTSSIPNILTLSNGDKLVMEIYRPAKVLSDEELVYYEIGYKFNILKDSNGEKYHEGQENRSGIILQSFILNTSTIVFYSTTRIIEIISSPNIAGIGVGNKIEITGSSLNDGIYTILNLAASGTSVLITIAETLVNETNTSLGIVINKLSNPDKSYAYINMFGDGDYYYKVRGMVCDTANNFGPFYVAEKNFSETYLSAVWSKGRPLVIDESIKEEYYPAMIRFSQSYIYGTNINNTNRFYPNNFEEADASFGDILRLKTRENFIRMFQRYKVGMIPIYRQIIIDNANSSQVALSEKLLNKPNYYSGEYGIDKYGSSLISTDYGDYFIDTNNKAIVRVSLDGITNISDTNNLSSWANENIKEHSYGYGCFNYENRNVIMLIGDLDVSTSTITNNIVAYNEPDKKFESFYGYTKAQSILFINGFVWTLYVDPTFQINKGWHVYKHNSIIRNNFFGEQQSSSITTVFNGGLQGKKTYTAIEELSNGVWTGSVATGPLTNQLTNIAEVDFQKVVGAFVINSKENKFNATIKRDINSLGGKYLGIPMKGLYAQVALTNSLTTEQRLISVSLKYIQSPLTNS